MRKIGERIVVAVAAAGLCGGVAAAGWEDVAGQYALVPYTDNVTLRGAPSYVPTGCPEFTVARPRGGEARVVRAADFGLSEGRTDNGAAINRALAECARTGAKRLELAPGTYKIHDPVGIVIDSLDDFTFDGMGAVLVFQRPPRKPTPQYAIDALGGNMLVTNCHRTVVRNFKMDWDWEVDPLGFFGRVVNKHVDAEKDNASYFDVKLTDLARHPKYPRRVPFQLMAAVREDRTNIEGHGWGCTSGFGEGNFGSKNEWISETTLRVWPGVLQEGEPQLADYARLFSPARNRWTVKHLDTNLLYRVMHCYYGQNGVNLHSCEDLTVEDVDIWSCRGMGFQAVGTMTRWQVLRSSVALPEHLKGKRVVTSTADANHIVQSKGWCKFEDCRWSFHIDDMNNFHDRLTTVEKRGPRALFICNARKNPYFLAAPGERVRLLNADYSPVPDWEGVVTAVEGDDTIVLDREVPRETQECFQIYKSDFQTDNVIIRRCDFTDGFGRNLLQSRNMTVEDCVFRHVTGRPLDFVSEWTYTAWCEGVGVSNIVVRGCLFDANYDNTTYRGIRAEVFTGVRPRDAKEQWMPNAKKVDGPTPAPWRKAASGVLLERNRFRNAPGLVWHALAADDLIFRDNVIEYTADEDPFYRPALYRGSCLFTSRRGVSAYGNTFKGTADVPAAGIYVPKSGE